MFEFLFKYRPLVYERGELALGVSPWLWLALAAALAVAVPTLLRYRQVRGDTGPRQRLGLIGLRVAILMVVLFALARPVLLVSTVVPQRNFLAVLLDDSRSMRVADMDGRTRAAVLAELFGGEAWDDSAAAAPAEGAGGEASSSGTSSTRSAASISGTAAAAAAAGDATAPLRQALEERFRVRYFAMTADAARSAATGLTFQGARTDLATGLDRARQELAGLPLSAIVLVSDGAHNADTPIAETLLSLRGAGVSVYTVGLGRETITPDIEVRRVELPRTALLGSTLVADVLVSHAGFAGRPVRVDVEDAGRILGSRTVELPADGELAVQVQFTASESGPRRLLFRVRPEEGEAVEGNNVRPALLEVADRVRKVLYFEGEPRFELKFLRRAVRDDPNLQLVVLLRSADEKFLRLDVDDAEELAGGFPRTREELFRYDGIVLGSVEASFFTHDQLQMIADFVDQRGGGLLVLGGRRALAEGGYAGTPLADALPVVLEAAETEAPLAELRVALTPAGRRHPALRVAEDEEASAERWAALPPVTGINRIAGLKPGAVALLTGRDEASGDRRAALAYQRYGRGVAIAFPIQDSWMWQMHADVPVDDLTHETLWRQLLRWLAGDAPGRIRARASEESVNPGEPVAITAEVEDERYLRVNGAAVSATVISPTGIRQQLPLEWTVDRDGEYELRLQPDEEGLYEVRVERDAASPESGGRGTAGRSEGSATGQASAAGPTAATTPSEAVVGVTHFISGPTEREQFGAGMRRPLLEQIAEETGGRFYTAEQVGTLAEEIRYQERGNTVVETKELWDMPILFLLLLGLLGAEWGFRRWRGLA